MRKKLFFGTIAVLAFALTLAAADITGKWVAQVEGRNGNTTQVTFDLKADGATLTGTVTGGMGGRGGRRGGGGGGGAEAAPAPAPIAISDGKIDGSKVTFSVKMDRGGQTVVTTYTGTFSGDDLKLKQTRQGRNGERTTDIAAKRATT